jgi:hypothetical protein
MRKPVVIAWLIFLFAGIVALFWRNEWIYSLPTPVPSGYHAVNPGVRIELSPGQLALIGQNRARKKPLFLHFFNPDCPCSRFNMPHFKELVKQYDQQVDFAIVLMTGKKFTAAQIQHKFNLSYPIPVLTDTTLAISCGVYSTPQAVIIDTAQKLYYRGNYNRSRYCRDEKTSFAKIALDSLLQNNLTPNFSPLALKAYGCQLPTCTK